MKVLDVDLFQDGLQRNITMLTRLSTEMETIHLAVVGLVQLDEQLKGAGGNAIRSFYEECHVPFLQFFQLFSEHYQQVLRQMEAALYSLEPDPSGYILETFLEGELEQGLTEIGQLTASLTDEANSIMDQVSDIIGLPHLDDSGVQEGVISSKKKRDDTISQLYEFDATQTSALHAIEQGIQTMETWLSDLEGMFESGLTDTNFQTDQWTVISSHNSLKTDLMYRTSIIEGVPPMLNRENQLRSMFQTYLIGARPIRFGYGGFLQKPNVLFGPSVLAFSHLPIIHPRDSESINPIDETDEEEMEAIYAALAKYDDIDFAVENPWPVDPNTGEYIMTLESKKRVLGGINLGNSDEVSPIGQLIYSLLMEDIVTFFNPETSTTEKAMAAVFTLLKPIKVLEVGSDVIKKGEKSSEKAKDAGKGTGELNKDLAKAYLRDIEAKTGRKVNIEQIHLIKEALRNKNYEKLTPKETAKHRSKFTSSLKDKLIAEWEEKNNQKWPRYTEEVLDKNGEVARSIGQPYDAHHIIENNFGGPHEWWNIHPAKYPNEHQAGIHGKGAPSGKLFPRR